MSLELDFSDVNENAGSNKEGYQKATVTDVEIGQTKTGKPMLKITFKLNATDTKVNHWLVLDPSSEVSFRISKEAIIRILSNKYQKSFKDTVLEVKNNSGILKNVDQTLLNIELFVEVIREEFYNIKHFYSYGEPKKDFSNRVKKETKKDVKNSTVTVTPADDVPF